VSRNSKMKAVVVSTFGGPETLQIRELPVPVPQPGEVLIRTSRAGVAFGDTLRRQGLAGAQRPPFTPGYDVVGRIEALGADVRGWSIGDRVAAYIEHGGYSEAVCASADTLARVPARVDDTTAVALVLNYGTAYQMLRHVARLRAGQSVVITSAAGGVGTAVLDICRALDIRAIGLASHAKHDVVAHYGGTPVDYRDADVVPRVRSALGGRGADAVLDGIGGNHLWRSRAMAVPSGQIVLFGVSGLVTGGQKRPLGILPTMFAVAATRLLRAPKLRLYFSTKEQTDRRARYATDIGELLEMTAAGRLSPLIHREIALSEVAAAHREMEMGSVAGKIVIAMA
jgi:NADPH2:quinone reductase